MKKIAVIGGGAAGMMAAGTAAMYGADVTIFEGTDRLGKKLSITGKGRCNVTNASDIDVLMANVTKNNRFLYSAFNAMSAFDLMHFFEGLGVKLKTERGNRVFPDNDKAKTIVDAMRSYCSGARTVYSKVKKIDTNGNGFLINSDTNTLYDAVIIATGGRSYPLTGCDGSGYRLAAKLGHSINAPQPSLVPLTSPSTLCKELQGLSLKNVSVSIEDKNGKKLYTDFGEMMFTHFGVTGPTVLSASAHLIGKYDSGLTLSIDLKPALDEKTLDERLLGDFRSTQNKDFINSLGVLLPAKMIVPFVELCGIDGRRKVNTITKEERHRILCTLKCIKIPISGTRPIEEAIITSGGIDVKEVRPGTMESKLVPGLYFAGEILDVDAYTGGFNLQIAFSTGYLAGKSAAE